MYALLRRRSAPRAGLRRQRVAQAAHHAQELAPLHDARPAPSSFSCGRDREREQARIGGECRKSSTRRARDARRRGGDAPAARRARRRGRRRGGRQPSEIAAIHEPRGPCARSVGARIACKRFAAGRERRSARMACCGESSRPRPCFDAASQGGGSTTFGGWCGSVRSDRRRVIRLVERAVLDDHAVAVRVAAGDEGGARRRAERGRAERILEGCAARRERVGVLCLRKFGEAAPGRADRRDGVVVGEEEGEVERHRVPEAEEERSARTRRPP